LTVEFTTSCPSIIAEELVFVLMTGLLEIPFPPVTPCLRNAESEDQVAEDSDQEADFTP
jgi:hypothetical protein